MGRSVFNPGGVPQELQERDQWLLWDSDAETPRRPHWKGDFQVSWSEPDEWHSFEDAVEAARQRESWGIGYVCAIDNPDYARGLYGVIDIDGGLDKDGDLKDWVPALDRFIDAAAYMEYSPSGKGIHIPIVGQTKPDWFSDVQLEDGDHEGVDYLTNKFCTFTGSKLDVAGETVGEIDAKPWLIDATKNITGKLPRDESAVDESRVDFGGDDYLDDDDVREALSRINPDVGYNKWLRIGFAVHDYDSGSRGQQLFEEWSRKGSKWDSDAERSIKHIWQNASPGSGITVATLVHHAKQNGWRPPKKRSAAAADGGASAIQATQPDGPDLPEYESLQERVKERVVIPLDPEKYGREDDVRKITSPEAVDRFASILDDEFSYVRPREDTRGWRDTLYVYSEADGIYEPFGESHVETKAERLLGQWATNHRVKEVVSKIERRNRINQRHLEPDPDRLVVANGILNLADGELDDHTPNEYHRTMIPVRWNPEAECPAINEFLHDVVDDSDVGTLYRFVAHCLYKEYRAEKAAMLLGDGENGKSTFLSLVQRFLGQWNVSNQSLIDLNMEDFAAQNLVGKLCNIHPDLSNQSVKTLQMFKKLTGRDAIDADVKFENPVTFENYATLIFACNRMPALHDDTRGNWRRWVLIEFPYTFERDDDDYVEKTRLMEQITADEEFEGLLVRCVREIQRALETGRWFPDAPGWRETRKQIMRASEPVYDFAEVCLEESAEEDAYVIKSQVREAYRAYAAEEGLPTMSREKFGQKLLNETDLAIESSQKRVDGHRRRVYEGVQFTSRGNQLVYGLDDDQGGRKNESLKEAGGPRKRADRVYNKLCEITDKGEAIEEAMLAGAMLDSGLTDKQIRQAIGRLIDRGRVSRGDDDKLEAMR